MKLAVKYVAGRHRQTNESTELRCNLKLMGCHWELRWGETLRAIKVDCNGNLKDLQNRQCESMPLMQHWWLSDCKSMVSYLKKPKE